MSTITVLGLLISNIYISKPPGTTFLYTLDTPTFHGKYSGGDTAFVSQVEAYNRLSEPFRKRLEGLTAVHSAHEQAEFARKRGGVVRREPITSEHPVIRTHPVGSQPGVTKFSRTLIVYFLLESRPRGRKRSLSILNVFLSSPINFHPPYFI